MAKDWTGDYFSISGTIGARNLAKEEREENDFYATDPKAAEWLLKIEKLGHRIWEPACGAGHISKVLEKAGHEVRSTDLIYRGYGETSAVDFLKQTEPFAGDIVTNPPYKYAREFVEKALELIQDGNKACLFLKLTFLEGSTRERLFTENPPARVWVSRHRIDCAKNGAFKETHSMVAFGWFIWEKGYKGDPAIKWFN